MSWSYSGDPSNSALDQQRFLIGDTNSARPIFSDEEIKYEISQAPNAHPYTTAMLLCEQAATLYASQVDKKTDTVSVFSSQRAKAYQERAARYRAKIPAVPYAGGLSKSEKASNRQNSDALLPYITKDSKEFSVADQAAAASQGGM